MDRKESASMAWSMRRALLPAADLCPWLLGGTFVWLGLTGWPALALIGAAVLVGAAVLHFGPRNGFLAPRWGRVRIAACGCGEMPQAFFVRHRGRGLLFYRAFDEATGLPPEHYCVIALPAECDEDTLRWRGFEPPEDSRLVGVVPAHELRFGRWGGDHVDGASLFEAMGRIGAQPTE
jgi:hypothetical protein